MVLHLNLYLICRKVREAAFFLGEAGFRIVLVWYFQLLAVWVWIWWRSIAPDAFRWIRNTINISILWILLTFQLFSEFVHPIFWNIWLQFSSSPLSTRTLVSIGHFLDELQLSGEFFDLLIFVKIVLLIFNVIICPARDIPLWIRALRRFFTHLCAWIQLFSVVSAFLLIVIARFLFGIAWLLLFRSWSLRISN